MTDWLEMYKRRDWTAVENWWRHCENSEELKALLCRLQADVPRVIRENGTEQIEDFVKPNEAPDEWKGASTILLLGELEAELAGVPEPVPDEWRRDRVNIIQQLKVFTEAEEVTVGDPALSRSAHATNALEYFEKISWCVNAMANEIERSTAKNDDREWLITFADEIVSYAFQAGAHSRAAIGKEIESHALRGRKILRAAQEGTKLLRQQRKPINDRILRRMKELIDRGYSQSSAAEITAKEGLGTSKGANLQLWKRHRKK